MERWVPGDVLRWAELDWFQKGKRKKEFFKNGEYVVSAQVREVGAVYVKLEVLHCDVASDRLGNQLSTLYVTNPSFPDQLPDLPLGFFRKPNFS